MCLALEEQQIRSVLLADVQEVLYCAEAGKVIHLTIVEAQPSLALSRKSEVVSRVR